MIGYVQYVMLILLVPALSLLMFWQANDIRKSYKNAERIKKETKSIHEINELILKLHKDYRLFLFFAFLMLFLSIVIIILGPNAFIS